MIFRRMFSKNRDLPAPVAVECIRVWVDEGWCYVGLIDG